MTGRGIKGEGSMYQRASDGRWVGVVDLGWVGGRRVRKTVSAPTLRELRPKFKALKRQTDQGVLADDMTVEQWLAYWVQDVADVRQRTRDGYRGYITTWLVPQLGKYRLDRLRPEHIRALHKAMEKEGKSDATRRQAHAILRSALAAALLERKIEWNPAQVTKPPPVGKTHRKPLTLEQALQVIASLDAHRDPAAASRWLCALLEGVRQGEALGLRWEDVDLDGHRLHIRQAIQRQKGRGLVVVEPKSATSKRGIPMLDPVHYALTQHAQAGTEGYVWGGPAPLDPRRDWQAWRDMLDAAGVPGVALHAARNTTASLLDRAGVSMKVISEILGHAQISVTQSAYVHGDESRHVEGMAALQALLGGE